MAGGPAPRRSARHAGLRQAIRNSIVENNPDPSGAGPSRSTRYPGRDRKPPPSIPYARALAQRPLALDWTNVRPPRASRVASLTDLARAALGQRVPSLRMLAANRLPRERKRRGPPGKPPPRTHTMMDMDKIDDRRWDDIARGAYDWDAEYDRLIDEAADVTEDPIYLVPIHFDTRQPRPHHAAASSSSSANSKNSKASKKRRKK